MKNKVIAVLSSALLLGSFASCQPAQEVEYNVSIPDVNGVIISPAKVKKGVDYQGTISIATDILDDSVLPETLTKVTTGKTELAAGTGYTYTLSEDKLSAEFKVSKETIVGDITIDLSIEDKPGPTYSSAVILFTSDVHTHIERELESDSLKKFGLQDIADYKQQMITQFGAGNVVLADNGDYSQGAPIGTLTKGVGPIKSMVAAGYDIETIGNHEFDFGMEQFLENAKDLNIVSSNFKKNKGTIEEPQWESVFDAYQMKNLGGRKVAFIGLSTPETFTKSTPIYFQDEDGNYIYSFCEGKDGQDLYDNVQASINAAKANGAELVVALSHLGTDDQSEPWRSTDVISKVSGLDLVLDGHSHSKIAGEKVKDKDNKDVTLVGTGEYLEQFGKVVISPDGKFTVTLETPETVTVNPESSASQATAAVVKTYVDQRDQLLSEVVAATSFDLKVTEIGSKGEPIRAVRSRETNMGDINADAYVYSAKELLEGIEEVKDLPLIAFVNGGGVRDEILLESGKDTRDITLNDVYKINPFSNSLCVIKVKGQAILDALEWGAKKVNGDPSSSLEERKDENGGFLQVSGIKYDVNTDITESPCLLNDKGEFAGIDDQKQRRVLNVKIMGGNLDGTPIDAEKDYLLAGHNYMLKNGGDGFKMFGEGELIINEAKLDNQVLGDFFKSFGGKVPDDYKTTQGRINIGSYSD